MDASMSGGGQPGIMSIEDITKTLTSTVQGIARMEEQYNTIASDIASLKGETREASDSQLVSAAGKHGFGKDKDKNDDDNDMNKKASESYSMIKKMAAAVFTAAKEKDEDKRVAAIEEALRSEVTTKMAALEAAVNDQSKVIVRQNMELARPRIDFLSEAYGNAGADQKRLATMRASWSEMDLDSLDEEVSRVEMLQNNYGAAGRPSVGDPVRAARSAASASAGSRQPDREPIDNTAVSGPQSFGSGGSFGSFSASAAKNDTAAHDLFMTPLRELRA